MGTHRKSDSAARKSKWQKQFTRTEANKKRYYNKMTESWMKAHPNSSDVPDWTKKPNYEPKPKAVRTQRKISSNKKFVIGLFQGKSNPTPEQIKKIRSAGFIWDSKTKTVREPQGDF